MGKKIRWDSGVCLHRTVFHEPEWVDLQVKKYLCFLKLRVNYKVRLRGPGFTSFWGSLRKSFLFNNTHSLSFITYTVDTYRIFVAVLEEQMEGNENRT